jgi:heme oxygenase (mycobilin-producing)
MTVISILDIKIKTGALADAAAVLSTTLAATRARPGCKGVDVTVDVDDPEHYVIVETWATLGDDDAYRAWRGTPEGASPLGSVLAGPPTLTRAELREDI